MLDGWWRNARNYKSKISHGYLSTYILTLATIHRFLFAIFFFHSVYIRGYLRPDWFTRSCEIQCKMYVWRWSAISRLHTSFFGRLFQLHIFPRLLQVTYSVPVLALICLKLQLDELLLQLGDWVTSGLSVHITSDHCDYIRFNNSTEMEQLLPLPLIAVKIQPEGNKQNSFNVARCFISTQPQLTFVSTCQVEQILTCLGGLKKRP